MMKLDQLRAVLAVINAGSFRAASETLHRTQSAISHAIKLLEEELGFDLFDRDGYRPTLTDAGQRYVQRAMSLIREADELKQFANVIAQGIEPSVHIYINPICLNEKILKVLGKCRDEFPETQLQISCGTLGQPMEKLLSGEADMVINTKNIDQSGIEFVKISTLTLINVAQKELAKRISDTATDEFHKSCQVVVTSQIESNGRNPDYQFGVVEDVNKWLVSDHFTKRLIISSGLGWGRLPEAMINEQLKKGELVPIHVAGVESPLELTTIVVKRCNQTMGPVLSMLWQELGRLAVK